MDGFTVVAISVLIVVLLLAYAVFASSSNDQADHKKDDSEVTQQEAQEQENEPEEEKAKDCSVELFPRINLVYGERKEKKVASILNTQVSIESNLRVWLE